jgi:hypothetical protein
LLRLHRFVHTHNAITGVRHSRRTAAAPPTAAPIGTLRDAFDDDGEEIATLCVDPVDDAECAELTSVLPSAVIVLVITVVVMPATLLLLPPLLLVSLHIVVVTSLVADAVLDAACCK